MYEMYLSAICMKCIYLPHRVTWFEYSRLHDKKKHCSQKLKNNITTKC